MKNILFLLLLSPLSLLAQRDFDYTLYTTKAVYIDSRDERPGAKPDTLNLSLFRKFEKQANTLKSVSLVNTADAIEYKLEFAGVSYQTGCPVLLYKVVRDSKEALFVFIDPMEPSVLFKSDYTFQSYH